MGIMDMVKKAQANMKGDNEGEYFAKDQTGQMLVHSFTFFETDKGKWGALKGEIVDSKPRVQGAFIQPSGTKMKLIYKCHGDYPLIGYEGVLKAVKAIYDPADDAEIALSMQTCFGSDESGFTGKAKPEDRKHPLFAARGVLVGFSTKNAKNSEKRAAEGKVVFVDVALSHIEQEVDAIQERAKKLPEVG